MAIQIPNVVNALGSVAAADGAAVSGAGFTSARTSTGVYTLTLDQPVDADSCAILVTPRGGVGVDFTVAQTSDSVKTVNFFTTGTGLAVDRAFDFAVLQAPQGA